MKENKIIIMVISASVILGGFYYLSETNKSASIERQQQAELQAKKEQDDARALQESREATQRSLCVSEAEQAAVKQYNTSALCTGYYPSDGCNKGTYLVANYNNAYNTCLQRKGLK